MKDFTGTKVRHKSFGIGVITSWEETMKDKNGRHFTIKFPSGKEMSVSSPMIYVNEFITTDDPALRAQFTEDIITQKQ